MMHLETSSVSNMARAKLVFVVTWEQWRYMPEPGNQLGRYVFVYSGMGGAYANRASADREARDLEALPLERRKVRVHTLRVKD